MVVKSVSLIAILLVTLTQAARLKPTVKNSPDKCLNKLMTSYSRQMLDAIRPSSAYEGTYHLQQRFIAGVHLYGGVIQGMHKIQSIEEPTRLFCHNDSVAALQSKFKIPDVDVAYGFAFASTTEVRGKLSLPRQDFFIDIDLEKDQNRGTASLLGVYMTQPNDGFKFVIESGAGHQDIDKIKAHVNAIARMCFARDARTAVLLDLSPKIELFIQSHTFSLE